MDTTVKEYTLKNIFKKTLAVASDVRPSHWDTDVGCNPTIWKTYKDTTASAQTLHYVCVCVCCFSFSVTFLLGVKISAHNSGATKATVRLQTREDERQNFI